ncbi:MAG TPA: PAS domain-containing protein [Candidatus Acidoferrales bacterium]|nr:PAS domain-containing protein [Candidatus Acidoferrales bacterium]
MITSHTDDHSQERRSRRGRRLTDRQSEILGLISEGLENKEIGRRLGLTEQAVKEHVSALLRRLSVRNRAGLADAAATLRIIGSTEVSSEWMHLLFLHAPMFVALLDGPEHRFIAVNDSYRRAAGPRDLVGKTFREAFPDLDEAGIVRLLDEAFNTGESRSAAAVPALWYRGANGAQAGGHLTAIVEPMRHSDGSVGGVVFFGLDVTAEIEARTSERESRDERHIALEQLPSGVITIRADGTISDLNAAGRDILGLGEDSVGQSAWGTLSFLDDRGRELPLTERPLHRALLGERVPPSDYRGFVTRTKKKIALRVSAAPLFGADGKVRGAVGVFTPSG